MRRGYDRQKLVGYIVERLEANDNCENLAKEIAAFLVETGHTSDLGPLMRDAQDQRAERYGVVELTARSAHELGAAQVKQIEEVAQKQYEAVKQVQLHKLKDDSVIGGANIQFPHANLDITIKNRLNQLREAVS